MGCNMGVAYPAPSPVATPTFLPVPPLPPADLRRATADTHTAGPWGRGRGGLSCFGCCCFAVSRDRPAAPQALKSAPFAGLGRGSR